VQASFEEDSELIHEAANCMAFMIIEHTSADGNVVEQYLGSAFFISPTLLLTAGHNILGPPNVKVNVRIGRPGAPYINYAAALHRKIPTIVCKIVASLYKSQRSPSHHDIAILDAGTYDNGSSYLNLSPASPTPSSKVNVVGYPGSAKQEWLMCHDGITDAENGRRKTADMFPAQRMTITSGPVNTVSSTISYKLSTIPGMSGGCVLHEGKVIGIS
jgi:V8-like Glu-specific endopeptidase